jgi:hypothetical protein
MRPGRGWHKIDLLVAAPGHQAAGQDVWLILKFLDSSENPFPCLLCYVWMCRRTLEMVTTDSPRSFAMSFIRTVINATIQPNVALLEFWSSKPNDRKTGACGWESTPDWNPEVPMPALTRK